MVQLVTKCKLAFVLFSILICPAFAQSPTILAEGIGLNKILDVGSGNIRLVQNPATGGLYMLHSREGLFLVKLEPSASLENIAPASAFGGEATGLAFAEDGTAYVVSNLIIEDSKNIATIQRGSPQEGGGFVWETVARTEAYPRSNTVFNHNYNAIVVSPDSDWLYINAGSRTDHGEVQDFDGLFPDTREVPLTTKIIRIPSDAVELTLPNDEAALIEDGYIFAWGVRNAYDLAFAPNGDLFGVENGPDADYPEELNWLREGHHYGFPWQFGDWDNQQQFPDYDSSEDKLQHPDFIAVQEGYYQNDPDFPPPPTDFTMPIANVGPDAMIYRSFEGEEVNAAEEGEILYTFTPHRSPLGLVFVDNDVMPEALQSADDTLSAFVLSWGAAGGTLSDRGMDVLHLSLSKTEDNYETVTHQIATDFKNPIDAVLVENKLYVLEWGSEGAIWELSFEN